VRYVSKDRALDLPGLFGQSLACRLWRDGCLGATRANSWLPAMLWATVPKTAVNENSDALPRENEVWAAREQLPARLTAEKTAWVLNCQLHDIPILVAARLLKPLGNPAPNGIKFFATADVSELLKDRSWLTKVTNTINEHWHRQTARKKDLAVNDLQNGHAPLHSDSRTA